MGVTLINIEFAGHAQPQVGAESARITFHHGNAGINQDYPIPNATWIVLKKETNNGNRAAFEAALQAAVPLPSPGWTQNAKDAAWLAANWTFVP